MGSRQSLRGHFDGGGWDTGKGLEDRSDAIEGHGEEAADGLEVLGNFGNRHMVAVGLHRYSNSLSRQWT